MEENRKTKLKRKSYIFLIIKFFYKIKFFKFLDSNNSTSNLFRIPTLALNEVFIGEALSARVSYYLMSIDDGPCFRQKSSGIIICTGTGSTSWCYNINKMSVQSVKRIINLGIF